LKAEKEEEIEGGNSMKINKIIVSLFLFVLTLTAKAQNFTDSNLPIVVIETDGGANIPDEPKVLATMKIIWHQDGSRNYLTDIDNPEFLNYDGRIGIELRGSSSQMFNKKPYGLETLQDDDVTNNNVSILGMPEENDWILNSLAYDQTGMRDVLSYELSNRLGQYASRSVYCEVMINGNYKGLYVFMEKIKPDKNRVNIEKMDETCNQYPEVTGGYITKADKTNGDPVAWTMQGYGGGWGWGNSTDFIHHYPKPSDITNAQNNYIHSVFTDLEREAGRHNTTISSGIPTVIDIPSFVDFMMIAEFASNVDVYSFSTFFHKDRMGKLRAGPVWDYNLAYGYDAFGNRSKYDVWQFSNQDNNGPKFFKDLFDTDLFRCYFAKRWFELTEPGQPLNYDFVCSRIDEIDEEISEAVARDNQRWNQMNQHAQYVNNMKTWLQQRINWLNNNIGSYQGCAEVDLPPLVISKIHYHPMDWWGIDGDHLEFIEITNNGNEEVDLTGIYFRELGLSYVFPNNSHLGAKEALVLCSDSLVFMDYYNITPFGQYTRKLSNKSENLVLADAWGNIIDQVHYSDSLPWPMEADGNGPYLQLKDLDSDNSLPENWTIGDDLTGVKKLIDNQDIAIYPNPTSGKIHIVLSENAMRCQIIDLIGNVLSETAISSPRFDLDLSSLPSGMYLVKVQFEDGRMAFRKVVKQ
jgi:spore coat protein CotH